MNARQDLLLEIGTEELPASFARNALEALPQQAAKLLSEARLEHGAMAVFGTPRRLALKVQGVASRQKELSEQVVGPPKSVGFDADGKLTRAGQGFLRKQGADESQLEVVENERGAYLTVQRHDAGRDAMQVLPELLSSLCERVPFAKTMRWGAQSTAFGRPVQWLVALFGAEVVPLEFAGVRAGRQSQGHRFLASEPIELDEAYSYPAPLRPAQVVADVEERNALMVEGLEKAARAANAQLVEDDFLVSECLFLVEAPHILTGSFDAEFLELPEEVTIAVMRDHQRYFALRDAKSAKLLPRYLNVVNTANAPDIITRGNDRVLRARLADARFFLDEDRKKTLAQHAEGLRTVVFQNKLGTVLQKCERLAGLIGYLRGEADTAGSQAAELCKADLVTQMVGEFPELEGQMGQYYAEQEGLDNTVAEAIGQHYHPRGSGDALPASPLGQALALADRLDTLVGCFGIGLQPTGSTDPFALRRAALGTIRIAIEGQLDVRLAEAVRTAHSGYTDGKLAPLDEVQSRIDTFFRTRLKHFYAGQHNVGLIEAALAAWPGESIRDLDARVQALTAFVALPEYASLTEAFKRAHNISREAPAGEATADLFRESAERELAACFASLQGDVRTRAEQGDYRGALLRLSTELKQPIDRFFEEVFVMDEDSNVRDNRLRLLASITRTLSSIAHFHLLA